MSDSAPNRSLQPIRPRKTTTSSPAVVLIPGIGTLDPEKWNLEWLPTGWPVYKFGHDLNSELDIVTRSRLEDCSAILSELLQELHKEQGVPLLLIHKQLEHINLAGIVFFSPIHITPKANEERTQETRNRNDADIQRIVSISQSFARNPLDLASVESLHPWLAERSSSFVKLMRISPMKDKAILTVFEAVQTVHADGTSSLTIAEDAVRLGLKQETLLRSRGDHNSTCDIDPGSTLSTRMHQWLEGIIPESLERSGSLQVPRCLRHGQSPSRAGFITSPILAGDDARSQLTLHTDASTLNEGPFEPEWPCHYCPMPRNPQFRGRLSELRLLEEHLCPAYVEDNDSNSSLMSVAITGAGGLGKSQTTLQFVHMQMQKQSFDAIFWVPADSPGNVDHALCEIVIKLGLVSEEAAKSKEKHEIKRLLLEWLACPVKSHREKDTTFPGLAKWLMVFDNADNHHMLADIWPKADVGAVLVTSRDVITGLSLFSTRHHIRMKTLSPEVSRDLLLEWSGRSFEQEDARSIDTVLAILDGLPFALAQIATVIARFQYTFTEFLNRYNNELTLPKILTAERVAPIAADYRYDLSTMWRLDDLSQQGKHLIDVMAFLSPNGIQEFLLAGVGKISSKNSCLFTHDSDYDLARTQLLQMSLIRRVLQNGQEELAIHHLVQDSARASMSDEHYQDTIVTAFQLVHRAWPRQSTTAFRNDTTHWTRCGMLYTQSLRLGHYAINERFKIPGVATKPLLQVVDLLLESAWFGMMKSSYEDTAKLLHIADIMLKEFVDPTVVYDNPIKTMLLDARTTYEHHAAVLALLINQRDRSLHHIRNHMKMLKDLIPKAEDRQHNTRWGVALNEFGNAYLQNGQPVFAEQQFLQSVSILNRIPSTSVQDVNVPLINLGYALWLQKRPEDAQRELNTVCRQRERLFGTTDKESPALGMLYLGLGNILLELEKPDESMRVHKLCHQKYKEALGEMHHRTADGSVKLADHHYREGNWHRTRELLEAAAKVYAERDVFKPERARVAYKFWKLAKKQGNDDVDKHAKLALKLYGEVCGNAPSSIDVLKDEHFDQKIMFWSR